eukprot:5134274-Karenia_brevis.AAC.1
MEPATETTCSLFKTIIDTTPVQDIEGSNTFWQINWCRVNEPTAGTDLHTSDGSRLWFLTTVTDFTGEFTVFIREKAALKLADCDSKEEFEKLLMEDRLCFPQLASVKIFRKPACETPTKDQLVAGNNVSYHIVEAIEQPKEELPSKQSMMLIELLQMSNQHNTAMVPATLANVQKSAYDGLQVKYKVENSSEVLQNPFQIKRCNQVLALATTA